jgi:hypothetical protein
MSDEAFSTAPRPFVFVLMPFDKDFEDIYKYGIKETAKEIGAYAERVDEQIYNEGILERVFNQINKADVIVADMTGRNLNVFYEVGYAHALGKIVVLLTQKVDDIPFDLKHRQHIVYGNDGSKIQTLRKELTPVLNWAIKESKKRGKEKNLKRISVWISGTEEYQLSKNIGITKLQEDRFSEPIPTLDISFFKKTLQENGASCFFKFHVRNNSSEETPTITHIYLFTQPNSLLTPKCVNRGYHSFTLVYSPEKDSNFLNKYSINMTLPPIPPCANEVFEIGMSDLNEEIDYGLYKIRFHVENDYYDFSFRIKNDLSLIKNV